MNAVVLTKQSLNAKMIRQALRDEGHRCVVTTTLKDAKEAVWRTNADCLYFARSLAGPFEDLFQIIGRASLLYVVIQEQLDFSDYEDAIAGINSHRVVDYLLCPLSRERILQSVALYQERTSIYRYRWLA